MTKLEGAQSDVETGTESRAGSTRSAMPRGVSLLVLAGLLVAAGTVGFALPAVAETARPSFSEDIVSAFLPIVSTGGFGWPVPAPDVVAGFAVFRARAEGERRMVSLPARVSRYEPPTITEGPRGVTIVRGPGSHHGVSP